ncbi:hypothetical protein [Paraburkholderia bannensis]|uniref:hypothetical protein n=1 Tax=Paraburkholderia bannensis TaxID=765414 RepID=UPI002AAF0D48|nr:hypothetical protein [Paraburkholderia bannensis]
MLVLMFLKHTFLPDFEGDFSNQDRSVELVISKYDDTWHVRETMAVENVKETKDFIAMKYFWSLKYGSSDEQRSLDFQPGATDFHLSYAQKNIKILRRTWLADWIVAHPYFSESIVLAWVIGFIFLLFDHKSRKDPIIIYPIWLAFFFALCGSSAALVYAGNSNLFDANGNPLNNYGVMLLDVMNLFLDIKKESVIFAGALFILVVPQWLAYAAAGVAGAAREVRFVMLAWKVVASLLAKSFISAAAVAMSISVLGNHYGWVRGEPKSILADLIIFLLLFSYGLVLLFFSIPGGDWKNNINSKPIVVLLSVHKWMKRRMVLAEKAPFNTVEQHQQRARPDARSPMDSTPVEREHTR